MAAPMKDGSRSLAQPARQETCFSPKTPDEPFWRLFESVPDAMVIVDRAERVFLRLDRTLDAAVFAAVYPTTKIGPDTPRSLRVRLSRAS